MAVTAFFQGGGGFHGTTLMRLSGAKELEDLLKRLPRDLAVEALEKAALAGATVIRNEARRRAPIGPGGGKDWKGRPKRPGQLRRSISVIKVRVSSGAFSYSVGLRRKSRAFYGRFLEFGAGPHIISVRTARDFTGKRHNRPVFYAAGEKVTGRKSMALVLASGQFRDLVRHPGVPARPWLRPALDEGRGKAIAAMGESLAASIERILGSRTYIRGFRAA